MEEVVSLRNSGLQKNNVNEGFCEVWGYLWTMLITDQEYQRTENRKPDYSWLTSWLLLFLYKDSLWQKQPKRERAYSGSQFVPQALSIMARKPNWQEVEADDPISHVVRKQGMMGTDCCLLVPFLYQHSPGSQPRNGAARTCELTNWRNFMLVPILRVYEWNHYRQFHESIHFFVVGGES